MQLYNACIQNIKNGAPKEHTECTWEFIWCKGNDISNNNEIKSSIIWKYKQKFDPIETSLEIKQEQWKDRMAPLIKKINYMIDHSLNQLTKSDLQ